MNLYQINARALHSTQEEYLSLPHPPTPQHGVALSHPPSTTTTTKIQCTPLHIAWSLVPVEAFEVLKFLHVLQRYYSEYSLNSDCKHVHRNFKHISDGSELRKQWYFTMQRYLGQTAAL